MPIVKRASHAAVLLCPLVLAGLNKTTADDAVPKVPANRDDEVVKQVEQQFGVQFKAQFQQLLKSELHFLRVVCQPTKEQFDKITADGEGALQTVIRNVALNFRGGRRGIQGAEDPGDPRAAVANALVKSAKTHLSADQVTKYQKELDHRTAARKHAIVLNLVAHADQVLVLTPDQRDKLTDILNNNWHSSWNQTQLFTYGGQYFPAMPDAKINPILSDAQKKVWQGVQKGNISFGIDLNFAQGIEIVEEVFEVEKPAEKPPAKEEKK